MIQSIHNIREKSKVWLNLLNKQDTYSIVLIVLLAFSSFGLGRLSAVDQNRESINISVVNESSSIKASVYDVVDTNTAESAIKTSGKYVGSRNGSKYHLPWCSGAQRMNEENKIWFNTKEEASSAGYTPAKNCKGI